MEMIQMIKDSWFSFHIFVFVTFFLETRPWQRYFAVIYRILQHKKQIPEFVKRTLVAVEGASRGLIPGYTATIAGFDNLQFVILLLIALAGTFIANNNADKYNERQIYTFYGMLAVLIPVESLAFLVAILTLCLTLGYIPLILIFLLTPGFFTLIYLKEGLEFFSYGFAILIISILLFIPSTRIAGQYRTVLESLSSKTARRKIYRYFGLFFPCILLPLTTGHILMLVLWTITIILWITEFSRTVFSSVDTFVTFIQKPVSKAYEEKGISGTSLYITGCAVASILPFPAGPVSIVMATTADPWAAMAGGKWGKNVIYRGKTLEGSISCLIICILAGCSFLHLYSCTGITLLPVITAACAGTAAELVAGRWDNLVMAPAGAIAFSLTVHFI